MKSPRCVCPDDLPLLRRLGGRAVAVRVDDIASAAGAAARVRDSGNELFCVIVTTPRPLGEIALGDEHLDVPLALMTPAMGPFRALARKLAGLRRPTVRVYLPCGNADNLAALRILSSLGIHGCADFAAGPYDWEALADLMTYAVLGRSPHAPIEPFASIAAGYAPHATRPWGAIVFDDPTQFLHLDQRGRIALSRDELRRDVFAADGPDAIDSPALAAAINERANAWRRYFVDNHPCAACAGWKACLGRFADHRADDAGCADFFAELIDVAMTLKSSAPQHDEGGPWRP